jgi:RNA polymerase sigma-70 factor, ECF subfamily
MADKTTELFEEAVRLHSQRLLAIARGILGSQAAAEDAFQQAMLNLFQHRERYDWSQPVGLLRRTVVNESLRMLRSPRMTLVADDHPGSWESPLGGMVDRETVELVRKMIAELPEHFRAALILCEYENLSYAEIADMLEVSIPQVKTWLHRGRRQLGEKLKDYMDARPKGDRPKVSRSVDPESMEPVKCDEYEELP